MDIKIKQDLGSEILLALDRLELKIMRKNLETENEKECSTPHTN